MDRQMKRYIGQFPEGTEYTSLHPQEVRVYHPPGISKCSPIGSSPNYIAQGIVRRLHYIVLIINSISSPSPSRRIAGGAEISKLPIMLLSEDQPPSCSYPGPRESPHQDKNSPITQEITRDFRALC